MKADVLVVGSGCSGLYLALKLPRDKQVVVISKSTLEESDSFLAQGGMCMLQHESDFDDYFEDTMKAGHYENDPESVRIMIETSPAIVDDLLSIGARFARNDDGTLAYTREGGHSKKRILFHKDITGQEITSCLLAEAQRRENIHLLEHTTMLDLRCHNNTCAGALLRMADGTLEEVESAYTVLACGGIGGLYRHSTNFRHLTGDGIAVALRYGIELQDMDYIQIHPTTLYSEKEEDRSFLISESVRGEGAKLYDKTGKRFANELLPRDMLTAEIRKQMEQDHTDYVWEDLRCIPEDELREHFPNIVQYCSEMYCHYDVTKEPIRVVPAQHYFMGGIKVDHNSKTSMNRLYAVGETACNGVHGKNRLASNSLLESMVFAGRAAQEIGVKFTNLPEAFTTSFTYTYDKELFSNPEALAAYYKRLVCDEIKRWEAIER